MTTLDEMIAVMQAYKEGKAIEFSCKGMDGWSNAKAPYWDWVTYDYRIKKQTKKVKLLAWLTPYSIEWKRECISNTCVGYGWKRVPSEDKEVEVCDE